MNTICIDSGFLLGLYDERDPYHSKSKEIFVNYFNTVQNQLFIPWPILYETISTCLAKNRKRMGVFYRDWKILHSQGRLKFFDDKPFRERAITEAFEETLRDPRHYRGLSLTDRVIRNILSEPDLKIDYFITFNHGDFADVCKKFRRVMI
jgi:predicted nucleic acid-binding protein